MDAAREEGAVAATGVRDLPTFNHWLCISRVRAVVAVAAFAAVLRTLQLPIAVWPIVLVCLGLLATSAVCLWWRALRERPLTLFYAQTFADLAAITAGIHFAAPGPAAMFFRPIYALVVVPSSLISVPCGLAVAAAASAGHAVLLGLDRGWSLHVVCSLEMLVPAFVFFQVAQQCFFYGAHLERKNSMLAGLANNLEENRVRLAEEHRVSAGLVEVARTLGSTLDAPELLGRVNRTTRQQLAADWTATFLIDTERKTFRLAAVTDAHATMRELAGIEFPIAGWPVLARLAHEPVIAMVGTDAERLPGFFTSGSPLSTLFIAALQRDGALAGFLAVGYRVIGAADRARAGELLGGIAQHATVALRNARLLEEVRLASAMKSEFVGAISHELRSPLNVILGYVEMMLDGGLGPLSEAQTDALGRTRQYTLSLLEMITALLDLNRLEAGRLPVTRAPVDVGGLLRDLDEQLPESWRRPGVAFDIELGAGLPSIDTDAGKLKTIVRNLVHNACKFTERGRITVSATVTPTGDVAIAVRDTGRGIPPDALGYVFDMFRQVPGSGGGGVGLGLHLVRRLLDVLGGTITVTSHVDVGTTFTVTLPGSARPPLAANAA